MPKFSQESFSKLATCHTDLQTLFYEVIKYFDCQILEGFRDEATQNKDFAAGKTKLQWPNGKHNQTPSLAVDVAPYPLPDWTKSQDFIYFEIYRRYCCEVLTEGKMTHGVRFGGYFNRTKPISDSSFLDLVHFELIA